MAINDQMKGYYLPTRPYPVIWIIPFQTRIERRKDCLKAIFHEDTLYFGVSAPGDCAV